MAEQKSGFVAGLKGRFGDAQESHPSLAHVVAMMQHYGKVQGNVLAGAVTYFGFLSFFPILAIAFAVVGYVSIAFPDARDTLVEAIEEVFPGIVTVDGANNTISLQQIENAKGTAGLIGFAVLLYAGLGWLSGLRAALTASFELPQGKRRKFVVGKAIDLAMLAVLGFVMLVSMGLAGFARGFTDQILDWFGWDGSTFGSVLVQTLGVLLGLASGTLMFFIMYRVLGKPDLPDRPLWQGALLGAAGFEALKFIAVNIIGSVGGSAFAPLAIAVTLMIWINYFSRLVFLGASWAMTSPLSADVVAERRQETAAAETVEAAEH
jgi:membrane protein